VGAIVTGIIGALAPVVLGILNSNAETRRLQFEAERARQERDSKEAEAGRSRPLIDPQLLEMMDRQAKRAEEQSKQFAEFLKIQADAAKTNMEAQATAQRSMLQTIADVAQLQLKIGSGESEGTDWGKIIAGALSGLAMMKAGSPAAQPMPPQFSAPPAANGGVPQRGPEVPEVPEAPQLDEVEKRIRAKAPPDQVVAELKRVLNEPEVQAEIRAEGSMLSVFEARLGDFAEDRSNEPYMAALVAALEGAGLATT
jgi:hypothetical protein